MRSPRIPPLGLRAGLNRRLRPPPCDVSARADTAARSSPSVFALALALALLGSGARAHEPERGGIKALEPNYLLLGADSFDSGEASGGGECDIKFQLSFARRLSAPRGLRDSAVGRVFDRNSPLFFGFTQKAWWDICRDSAPFRETNYSPGLFYRGTVSGLGVDADLLAGYLHQSNGVDGERSRRWERLFARVRLPFGKRLGAMGFDTVDRRRWLIDLSVWHPFAISDENEDIVDFAGYGELVLSYTPNPELRFRLGARKGGGLGRWERGLGELDVIFPVAGTDVQGLLQYTNGYGASLERFDRHEYALRIGVLFSDFGLP